MSRTIALALALASCGGLEPEAESPSAPTVTVGIGETPNGIDFFPPGWYVHLYPGLCVVVVRDESGIARECFEFYPEPCEPSDPRACSAFPIGR